MADLDTPPARSTEVEEGRTNDPHESGRGRRWLSSTTWRAMLRLIGRWTRDWSTERLVAVCLVTLVFLGSLWVIAQELHGFRYAEVWAYLQSLPFSYIAAAGVLTAATFIVLAGYDLLALRYVGIPLSYRRVFFSAFVGYAVSQAIGNPILTGGSVRYRLYTQWGLTPTEVAKAVLFAGVSFWLGFSTLGASVFLYEVLSPTSTVALPVSPLLLAGVCFVPLGVYSGLALFRTQPFPVWKWSFQVPPLWMVPVQITLATADLLLASSVIYVLLPPAIGISFVSLVAVYLLALLAGLVSHVPGGIGVFESIMLLALTPSIPAPTLLGALLTYRGIFHLLPLVVALAGFGLFEIRHTLPSVSSESASVGEGRGCESA